METQDLQVEDVLAWAQEGVSRAEDSARARDYRLIAEGCSNLIVRDGGTVPEAPRPLGDIAAVTTILDRLEQDAAGLRGEVEARLQEVSREVTRVEALAQDKPAPVIITEGGAVDLSPLTDRIKELSAEVGELRGWLTGGFWRFVVGLVRRGVPE